mgnify:CR=1 FL=1
MSIKGLQPAEIECIIDVFKAFPQVKKAYLFGSRAIGTHKVGSDVDIALIGKNIDQVITTISYTLNEETLLPYSFDLIDYETLTNADLKEHIDRVGALLYESQV